MFSRRWPKLLCNDYAWVGHPPIRAKLLRGHWSAYDARPGSAATRAALADELLYALRGIDFRGVEVALAIHAHLMQPVKITGHPAIASEPAEFLEIAPVQNVNSHVGIVCDIEATLLLVWGEAH